MPDIATEAIEEALKGNFERAIVLNRQILKERPSDIEALKRLAFALAEAGFINQAKKTYNKILAVNRFNPIALKNLKRLSLLKPSKKNLLLRGQPATRTDGEGGTNSPGTNLFLEEVGKTKVVSLVHLAEAKILSSLHPTNPVVLVPRRRGVAVTTAWDEYIGALPDDIGSRLYTLIRGGNKYEAYIKSAQRDEAAVFIRELVRKPKFRNQPSFLGKGGAYYPFVREEALAEEEKPDVSRLEDIDEEAEEGEAPAEETS